uniref:Methylenetetrahydrofolate reductase (NAD(P)H) n=1 Tax=Sexangularia sp. CB-2014 TaxID=1486929 RepID=A0A7S1VEP7_9EUKA|mmetsp:Transcript_2164/g.6841  ORF Transcript_2164/g.6841 Transcript_2164/m.6841 type:complete len:357 (+) Transcript_2164:159-1229(+)
MAPSSFSCLFGVTPPPVTVTGEKYDKYVASTVAAVLAASKGEEARRSSSDTRWPLALVIYDVQDEPSRSGQERPFPYRPSVSPHTFCASLVDELPSGFPVILTVAAFDRSPSDEPLLSLLNGKPVPNTAGCLVVGKCGASSPPDSISDTFPNLASLVSSFAPKFTKYVLGGIALPERNLSGRGEGREGKLMCHKTKAGITFFTTQVVYDADAAIILLRDYAAALAEEGDSSVEPAKVYLTFAPFSRSSVLSFLRWLGVSVPASTAARVLSTKAQPPLSQLASAAATSVDIVVEIYRRILDAVRRMELAVPVGFLVEAVSHYGAEVQAVPTMAARLGDVLAQHEEELGSSKRARVAQ